MVKVPTADKAPEEIMVSCICLPLIPKSGKNQTINSCKSPFSIY